MRTFYRLIAALIFGLAMAALHATPLGRALEREVGLPLLYAIRGPLPPPPEAMIIGLDNESVNWLTNRITTIDQASPVLDACLPQQARIDLEGAANINHIPRSVHACLIDVLSARGARVILFDINFNRKRHDDELLGASIANAGNVLLFEKIGRGEHDEPIRTSPRSSIRAGALGTTASHVNSERGTMATGYITAFPDFPDLQPMPVRVWMAWTGQQPVRPRSYVQPLWLYGPPGTIPTVRLSAVFDAQQSGVLPADLSNRAVFIGSSDPEDASIDDHFPIPTSGRGNALAGGVELSATGFLNLLHGTPLNRPGFWTEWLIVFSVGLIGCLSVLTLTRWWLSAAILVTAGGYMTVAALAFAGLRVWLPVTVPVLVMSIILVIAAISVRYFFARAMVSRLVPRQVASMLLRGTVADRRRTRVEDATIMFTDLVGSTALAEMMTQDDYTRAANLYYDAATETVEGLDGMVIEFLGDGILAMFSESVSGADHAAKACRAARGLSKLVDARNSDSPDLPDLRLRIGINSGRTATGDIGARTRFNFKALGDVVNVAARLEQHGKVIGAQEGHVILASGSTIEGAGTGAGAISALGQVTIRGRSQDIMVYRLYP